MRKAANEKTSEAEVLVEKPGTKTGLLHGFCFPAESFIFIVCLIFSLVFPACLVVFLF
jgi:hypothetical protein